jgi:uncharacterized phage protein (TIGR01671 family)
MKTNREIKFRAWDTEEKKMWDDFPFISYLQKITETAKFSGMILLQFTGLKDKSGKDIYEGDIMTEMKNSLPCKVIGGKNLSVWVVWNDKFGCWELDDNNKNGEYSITYKNWEIIGNIYENQELLK